MDGRGESQPGNVVTSSASGADRATEARAAARAIFMTGAMIWQLWGSRRLRLQGRHCCFLKDLELELEQSWLEQSLVRKHTEAHFSIYEPCSSSSRAIEIEGTARAARHGILHSIPSDRGRHPAQSSVETDLDRGGPRAPRAGAVKLNAGRAPRRNRAPWAFPSSTDGCQSATPRSTR